MRINDTTVNVHASGLADGSYRLVADRAKFNSVNQYTSISLDQGEGDADIYGDLPSSTMGDATLSLQTIGGTTLCTTNFTVLWVEISMRCGQDDNFSSDNGCAIKPSPAKLGARRVFVGGVEVSMGNNVEFIGRNQSFADIGKASSGEYFQKYIGKRPDIDDNSRKAIIAAIDRKLPFDLMNHARSFEVQRKYDAMRRVLLSRFSNELAKASSNIDDTISTMGFIRMLDAIPVLADNLTICPQVSTNAPNGFVFPAAEALIAIGPAIGDCFKRLKATKPLSVGEALWLRISHELYPEGLEYELYCAAATNDTRAARLLQSLPWRRLTDDDCRPLPSQSP